MTHGVFVSLPSARGVHPNTVWSLFDMRTALEKQGHWLAGSSVYRMPLDLARNELATVFLGTGAQWDVNLLLDDDVQVAAECIPHMLGALDAGASIVSAPCHLRDHSHGGAQDYSPFNVRPTGELVTLGGVRLLECEMTGLGAVMCKREVLQKLFDDGRKYASRLKPGSESSDIFTSQVVAAADLLAGAPTDLNVYALDDVVFSLKVRRLGFKIHAAIDVPTVHDGMAGCFAEAAEKLARAQVRTRPLLGADGKPL